MHIALVQQVIDKRKEITKVICYIYIQISVRMLSYLVTSLKQVDISMLQLASSTSAQYVIIVEWRPKGFKKPDCVFHIQSLRRRITMTVTRKSHGYFVIFIIYNVSKYHKRGLSQHHDTYFKYIKHLHYLFALLVVIQSKQAKQLTRLHLKPSVWEKVILFITRKKQVLNWVNTLQQKARFAQNHTGKVRKEQCKLSRNNWLIVKQPSQTLQRAKQKKNYK